MKNLDYEPGFWLTVVILLPFIAAVSLLDFVVGREACGQRRS